MSKRGFLFIDLRFFLLILFLILTGCTSDQPKLPRLTAGETIVAFGNSLTYGTGTTQDNSYPAVLERLIGFRVINAGARGETTQQSLQRLPSVLEKYQPALVILCIGGNDLLRRKPHQSVVNNLKKLIRMIKLSGASAVLIGVPQASIGLSVPDFYETVAREAHVPVDMKLLPKLLGSRKYKSDPIHLNERGYHAFAQSVAEFLKQVGAI